MSGSPISDLFSEPAEQQPSKPTNAFSWLLVVVLACILGYSAWSRWGGGGIGPRPDGDEHGDVKPISDEGYLIFIHERQTINPDELLMLDVAVDYCRKHEKLDYRSVDQNDPSEPVRKLIEFAKSKNIDPPCVVFKDASGKLRNAIKFPKSEAEMVKVMR